MNWTRVLVAAAMAVSAYLLHKTLDSKAQGAGSRKDFSDGEDGVSGGTVVNYLPPEDGEGFFARSREKQLDELIVRVKEGSSYELIELSVKQNCKDYMMQLLVDLLEIHDPRMLSETADTLTQYDDEDQWSSQSVNERVDDTDFKENLLYVIRDNLEADHPLLGRIVRAYDAEPNPYTRYRIVRALGKIGGERVQTFLRRVIARESEENTFASQVARNYLDS